MIKLLAFLGNPGKDYERTRHNAGFIACDGMFPGLSWQIKFHSAFSKVDGFLVLKPQTYMNLSGTAISEAASFFKLKADEICVIHDDIELESGAIKFQQGGGLQGHNGLRSIRERLGSDKFFRLRIGIGRPVHKDVRLYVTSPFTEDELIRLRQNIDAMRKLIYGNR